MGKKIVIGLVSIVAFYIVHFMVCLIAQENSNTQFAITLFITTYIALSMYDSADSQQSNSGSRR